MFSVSHGSTGVPDPANAELGANVDNKIPNANNAPTFALGRARLLLSRAHGIAIKWQSRQRG